MIQIDNEYRIYGSIGKMDLFLQYRNKHKSKTWITVSYHHTVESAYKKYARLKIKEIINSTSDDEQDLNPENVMTVKEASEQIEKLIEKLVKEVKNKKWVDIEKPDEDFEEDIDNNDYTKEEPVIKKKKAVKKK